MRVVDVWTVRLVDELAMDRGGNGEVEMKERWWGLGAPHTDPHGPRRGRQYERRALHTVQVTVRFFAVTGRTQREGQNRQDRRSRVIVGP